MTQAATSALAGTAAKPSKAIITISVMAATIMQSLDGTITNVALPRMQGALSASQDQMGWVLTSYIVAAAITIPLTGWLANAVGRRKVFLTSIVVFTAASLLCGIANSLPEIVVFRFLQGVGGAALVPLSQATLLDINEPRAYPRAMAMWAAAAQLGSICGPALGGWLTENLSWRWSFYVNLPVGALAFLGLLLTLSEKRIQTARFDVMGFATLSLAVASLQLLLDRGQQLDWFSSAEIRIEALVAGLGLYVFVVHMFTTDRPFLNPRLFADGNFVASNFFIFVVGVVLYASGALLAPMLQNELGYPVLLAGLVTIPRGVGTVVGMMIIGPFAARTDVRVVIVTGMLIIAYSLWQMTHFTPDMSYPPVIVSGIIQGFGIAIVFVPLSTAAFSTLDPTLRNEGAAMFSLIRNIGSSAGISVVFFLLVRNTQTAHASLTELVRLPNADPVSASIAARVNPYAPHNLAAYDALINHQASFIAYLDDFRLMMAMTIVALPFVLLIRNGRPVSGRQAAVMD